MYIRTCGKCTVVNEEKDTTADMYRVEMQQIAISSTTYHRPLPVILRVALGSDSQEMGSEDLGKRS